MSDHSHLTPSTSNDFVAQHHASSRNKQKRVQLLEDELCELAAHIDAAMFRWLELLREFDKCQGWTGEGIKSCAHWLNWKCGLSLNAARERLRVAQTLATLPQTTAAFREGRLSYSKVRAITRVATTKNESVLLNIAFHGTTWHVEQAVSAWRREQRLDALKRDNHRHDFRELSCYFDTDGFLVMKGRFTPEQGAVIRQALEATMDQLREEHKNVSAETSRRLCCDAGIVHWLEKKNPDNSEIKPLSPGRKTRTGPPSIRRALQRRDKGCCFPGCSCNRFVDAHHIIHWADGGETSMDNLMLLCRHHHRLVHEGEFGIQCLQGGEFAFNNPAGNRIPDTHEIRFSGNVFELMAQNSENSIVITPRTAIPDWGGEGMDVDVVVHGLQRLE